MGKLEGKDRRECNDEEMKQILMTIQFHHHYLFYLFLFPFRVEFYEHGMNDTIHLRHRNVCKEGFGKVGNGVDSG